jgi:hypothetical protein
MSGFVFGAGAAASRLGARSVVASAAAAFAGVVAVAYAVTYFDVEHAVDEVLGGIVFGVALPLLAYAAVGIVSGQARLEDAALPLSRHGASRIQAILGMVLAAALRMAAVGAALAAVSVLAASDHLDLATLADAFTSAWIGALGGAVYVTWFAFGALFGKGGRGRAFALGVDWILGSATSAMAIPWPRAHLRSLLGGELVLGLPEWQSTVVLYSLAGVYLLLTTARVRA